MTDDDRSWMYERLDNKKQITQSFVNGVFQFLEFAFTHASSSREGGQIKCPCTKCCCSNKEDRDTMALHLYKFGFMGDYTNWDRHGEPRKRPRVEVCITPHDVEMVEESNPFVDMVHDASRPFELHDEQPNGEALKFYDLLNSGYEKVYEGCDASILEILTELMYLKSTYGLSVEGYDTLMKTIQKLLPKPNKLPDTFYKAKQKMRNLGLKHEKIDACANNCILYRKEYKDLTECPTCHEPRFKTRTSGGRDISVKILRYFPLIPRLQRLYHCSKIAKEMVWHSTRRQNIPNELRHPSDGQAWKHFDSTHPRFASDGRNVRLGLSTDGFNPFGHSSSQYSLWPVIVTPYNLPPWMCNTQQFMFLTMLIPGPKGPKKEIDVYLEPLIDELKQLWTDGVETYDAFSKTNFILRASLLWTISDFPAYAMLSGWSTHGKLSCPYCMEETKSFYLTHSGKPCFFDCHRRFLPPNHLFRRQKDKFLKRIEKDIPLERMHGREIESCLPLKDDVIFGGSNDKRKLINFGKTHNWTKRSIFFELPYWSTLLFRHNLDVMHVEKNVFDNIFNTVMNVKTKTKDNLKSRNDLVQLDIRHELHPRKVGDKLVVPKASYVLDKVQVKRVCEWVTELRFPDSYVSNISKCVKLGENTISGMKSHDCHVFMQRLLPIAFDNMLPKEFTNVLTEVSRFFTNICSPTLKENEMKKLGESIVETICRLEKIFPPSFFDSMEHLLIHLPYEAEVGGPVQYRWMYPYER